MHKREHAELVRAVEVSRQEAIERANHHERGDVPTIQLENRKPETSSQTMTRAAIPIAPAMTRPISWLGARSATPRSGGSQRPARQIDDEAEHHHHAGAAEAVMPADLLAERAGNQRRGDHADVDEDVEDLERHRAAQVVLGIELADLGRDIALEQADADDQRQQREQERALERHQEMAERHHQRAGDQRDPAGRSACRR